MGYVGYADLFKRSDTDLSGSKETYKSVIGSASASGYTWGDQARGVRSYNHKLNKNITLNTGFVDESLSDLIEQLMMSEYVVMTINRTTTRVADTYTISQDFRTYINFYHSIAFSVVANSTSIV